MKKSGKLVMTLGLLLMLVISSALPAFAQLPEPFCGELSDEDCAILVDSQEAALAVESSSSALNVDILISGIPGLPADELAFNYTQEGSASLDPELAMDVVEMQQMAPEELMDDMDAMVETLLALYSDIALDVNVSFTMPDEIAELISADADIDVPSTLSAMFRMVDGYGYANIDELAAQIPELQGVNGWYGLDVVSLMEMGFEQSMAQADSGSDMAASMTGFGLTSYINSQEGRDMIADFVEVERVDDTTVDGQDAAVFVTTFDFGRFVGSPVFAEILLSQREMLNEAMDMNMTEAELREMLSLLPMFGPMLFTGLNFEIEQTIGLDDLYVHESSLTFYWDLSSLIAVAGVAGVDLDLPEGVAPVISMDVESSAADFNAIDPIEAPENAMIVDPMAVQ